MALFELGHEKIGGRAKGTPNKVTQTLKEILDQRGLDIPGKIMEILPSLSAEKQADVLLQLLSFLYPKRKSMEIEAEIRPAYPVSRTHEEREIRIRKIQGALDKIKKAQEEGKHLRLSKAAPLGQLDIMEHNDNEQRILNQKDLPKSL